MQRVLIVGCSGAGKTTLSHQLAEIAGLPIIHLDKEYWLPGWTGRDKKVWAEKVGQFIAEPRWIIDGNYGGTLAARLARADAVFFLDAPRRVCILRVLRRLMRDLGRTRADMAEGCKERFDWEFLQYVWYFQQLHRPRLIEAMAGFNGDKIVLQNAAEVAAYLSKLRGNSTKK